MGLGIFVVIVRKLRENSVLSRCRQFFQQIIGLGSPHCQKVPGQICIGFLSGHAIQLHQGQFNLLMARTASVLSLFRAKDLTDQICQAAGYGQDFLLACSLVIGHRRFDQVAGAVKLMAFHQILPFALRMADSVIGVQITVRFLGPANEVDQIICRGFVLLCSAACQTECQRFQPFVGVRITEHNAPAFFLRFPGSHPEILHAVGLFHLRKPVVENFPLVGHQLFRNHVRVTAKQRIVNLNIPQRGSEDILFHIASRVKRFLHFRIFNHFFSLFG